MSNIHALFLQIYTRFNTFITRHININVSLFVSVKKNTYMPGHLFPIDHVKYVYKVHYGADTQSDVQTYPHSYNTFIQNNNSRKFISD